ncbi:MAG: MarR family transcriptional regulator, partial [Trueperaceae bacterium]
MPRASSSARGRERIRAYNQSAVLSAIHRHGRISRGELASELRLSPAAITALTAPFVAEGLVVEAELGTSTSAGRKPILLAIDYDHAYVFGVK